MFFFFALSTLQYKNVSKTKQCLKLNIVQIVSCLMQKDTKHKFHSKMISYLFFIKIFLKKKLNQYFLYVS